MGNGTFVDLDCMYAKLPLDHCTRSSIDARVRRGQVTIKILTTPLEGPVMTPAGAPASDFP